MNRALLIFESFLLVFIASIALASENTVINPIINFEKDRIIGIPSEVIVNDTTPAPLISSHNSANLKRNLGVNQGEIISYYNNNLFIRNLLANKKVDLKYNYKLVRFYNEPSDLEGTYIINQNDKCIGYYLIDNFEITNFQNDNIVKNIKNLPINNTYLNGNLRLPQDSSITFYEGKHDEFIERYAIFQRNGKIYLLLDSFYPKELEDILSLHLIDSLINAN